MHLHRVVHTLLSERTRCGHRHEHMHRGIIAAKAALVD
jgi:hypothetical protein